MVTNWYKTVKLGYLGLDNNLVCTPMILPLVNLISDSFPIISNRITSLCLWCITIQPSISLSILCYYTSILVSFNVF